MFGLVVCDETSSLKSFRFSDPRLAYWLIWGEQDTLSTVTNPPTSGTATTTLAWPDCNHQQATATRLCFMSAGREVEEREGRRNHFYFGVNNCHCNKRHHDEQVRRSRWRHLKNMAYMHSARERQTEDRRTDKQTHVHRFEVLVCVCVWCRERIRSPPSHAKLARPYSLKGTMAREIPGKVACLHTWRRQYTPDGTLRSRWVFEVIQHRSISFSARARSWRQVHSRAGSNTRSLQAAHDKDVRYPSAGQTVSTWGAFWEAVNKPPWRQKIWLLTAACRGWLGASYLRLDPTTS